MSTILLLKETLKYIQKSFDGGDILDVIKRIDDLMKEQGWSDYRLSMESGLSSSTIANIHRRNTVPSIPTLEAICQAFGISLSQFFAESSDMTQVYLTESQKAMFDDWLSLTEQQKKILSEIITEFKGQNTFPQI